MGRSGRGVGDVHQEYSETIVMNNHLHSTEGQRKHPAAITRDQTASQVRLLHASSARSSGGWLVTPPARARLGQRSKGCLDELHLRPAHSHHKWHEALKINHIFNNSDNIVHHHL
jgi:hypothetical protein